MAPHQRKTFPKKQPVKKEEAIIGRKAKDRLEMKRIRDTTENFDKKEAALKIIESRRQENQNKQAEKPKTVVAASNMPWVPNPHFMLPSNSISALSIEDHRRYVAIITNFTRLDRNLRFEYNNIELGAMDGRLVPEREKFVAHVKEVFGTKGVYSMCFKGGATFCFNRIRERLEQLSYSGYQSIVAEVPWHTNSRQIANRNMYVRKPTVLSTGKSKKLDIPDPSRRCVFENDAAKIGERYPCGYQSKLLKKDNQAINHAIEHNVTAMLSSAAMRHLLTSQFPLRSYRRAFPLSIFRSFSTGSNQRVVSIGNPIPITPLSKPDMMRTFAKYIVRNSMERIERAREERRFKGVRPLKRPAPKEVNENNVEQKKVKTETPADGVSSENNDEPKKMKVEAAAAAGGSVSILDQLLGDIDEGAPKEDVVQESNLLIDDEEEEEEMNAEVEPESMDDVKSSPTQDEAVQEAAMDTVKSPSTPKPDIGTSLLDQLLGDTESAAASVKQPAEKSNFDVLDSIFSNMEANPNISNAPVTSHPYSYMIVPIDNENEHKVLVRSRPHGRDMANNLISYSAKVQYLPQCAAEEPFVEERIWNALTSMLKESSYHTDIHLTLPESNCLQISQVRSVKIFEALPEDAKELLSGRWQRFYNLLEEIKKLDDGEYLLVENANDMLEIWAEPSLSDTGKPQWTRDKIEAESSLNNTERILNEPVSFSSRFNGFSIHTPLIWNIVKGRVPVSFLPPNPNKTQVQNGQQQHGENGGAAFRGKNHHRGRGGHFRGRGRGRGARGGGRGNHRGNSSSERKPVQYKDHDADPFADDDA